jgi:hypothetical protein
VREDYPRLTFHLSSSSSITFDAVTTSLVTMCLTVYIRCPVCRSFTGWEEEYECLKASTGECPGMKDESRVPRGAELGRLRCEGKDCILAQAELVVETDRIKTAILKMRTDYDGRDNAHINDLSHYEDLLGFSDESSSSSEDEDDGGVVLTPAAVPHAPPEMPKAFKPGRQRKPAAKPPNPTKTVTVTVEKTTRVIS